MIQVLTFIDLRQQVLLLESPNCQIKLQISLKSHGFVNEELVLYGQRYASIDFHENFPSCIMKKNPLMVKNLTFF